MRKKNLNWKTYKDRKTGNTIIEVTDNDGKTLTAAIRPYMVRTMSQKEFQRLLKSLRDIMEKQR